MATKKPVVRKNTSKKKSSGKARIAQKAKVLYKERNPERHVVTGKFVFFYVLFACTTLFFAILAVWLYVFSSEMLNKYESVDACMRAHTTCKIRNVDGVINAEGE